MTECSTHRTETRPVRLKLATLDDAAQLTITAAVAFYDDRKWQPDPVREANLAQADPDKGPPCVDYEWNRRAIKTLNIEKRSTSESSYYKAILGDDRLVGGLLVTSRPDLGTGEWRCEAIFVDPDYHGRGIGKEILRQMFRMHPQAKRWALDTPEWAVRNHGFYERMGFTKFDVTNNHDAAFNFFDFENTLSQAERLAL